MSEKTEAEEIPSDNEIDSASVKSGSSAEEVSLAHINADDLISTYYLSDRCTIHYDILTFHHSFGYDCKRNYNMALLDEETLVFGSGNYLHFFNVRTKTLSFRRSAVGGGVGHIAKNPNAEYQHLAVAENGNDPPIIIYSWPQMQLVTLLKGGAAKSFSHLDYNPNGELLVSQGGEPDYLITVWTWKKHMILLRTESHVNDVYRVMFSPYCPGHITTAGHAHIKFWKMVNTFTGLKLLGDLGRYGKTEFSDIVGVYPMPDEKVLSGCVWGNILVWEAGLIKLEVFRKLSRKCHEGPIMQFDLRKETELWTVAQDGFVRVWNYDSIDQADPPDEERIVMIEPLYEFETKGLIFMCIIKCNKDENNRLYYAQDGNGGIWIVDLDTDPSTPDRSVLPSVQLLRSHAGSVMDISTSPWSHHFATLGLDGRIYFYDYVAKEIIHYVEYSAKGVCLLWLPLDIAPNGDTLIAAFDDGVLRILNIDLKGDVQHLYPVSTLIQAVKAHSKPITAMSVNPNGKVLVTGSEEPSIFIFQIQRNALSAVINLVPIGYINVDANVTYLCWKYGTTTSLLVGQKLGHFCQVEVPTEPLPYTTISYLLDIEPVKYRFETVKAQIRREIKLLEIATRKEAKRARKMKDLEKLKRDNPGLRIDEELFLEDSESEEELEPLYIPPVPNDILWLESLPMDTVCLSMSGYDAGYLYEYKLNALQKSKEPPCRSTMVHEADDVMIYKKVYDRKKEYVIFGMENGAIRINKLKDDFADFGDYWQLTMHDNLNGRIGNMCFSYDDEYFFSCGHDGNVFSYKFSRGEEETEKYVPPERHLLPCTISVVPDVENYTTLSLEQAIVKKEQDRINMVANNHKKEYWTIIDELRGHFSTLLARNAALYPTQIIPEEQLIVDSRLSADLNQKLADNLSLVKRKLAFRVDKSAVGLDKLMNHFFNNLDVFPIKVEGVENGKWITTFKVRKLDVNFYAMQTLVEEKIIEAERRGRPPERPTVILEKKILKRQATPGLEPFLLGLSNSVVNFKLGAKINRLLNKYRGRRQIMEERKAQRAEMLSRMPAEGVNHPEDEAALKVAKITIGDYKLKTAPNYKVSREQRETTIKKYKVLLETRLKEYTMKHNLNEFVYNMRDRKQELRRYLIEMKTYLLDLQDELHESDRRQMPQIPDFDLNEFPEKNLEVIETRRKMSINRRKSNDVSRLTELSGICPIYRFHLRKHDMLEKFVLPKLANVIENDEMVDVDMESLRCPPDKIFNATVKSLKETAAKEDAYTPFESDVYRLRYSRKMYEQTEIIRKMKKSINLFDRHVSASCYERNEIHLNSLFLELHLLTVHQELLVLQVFEAKEDELNERVNDRIREVMDVEDEIASVNNETEKYKTNIEHLQAREKEIGAEFLLAIAENKFADFLKKIYKKKYRPPKVRNPDDSSSSSSESSSESSSDDDAASLDSRDFGIVKLDENVCPKGCDPAVYNLTFALRDKRHKVELEIKEQYRLIDNCKKEVENLNKKVKNIQANLDRSQDELDTYMREKQKQLNEIMSCVVLKLSQMQHLVKNDTETASFHDVLVFSHTTLKKLYKRVDELKEETLRQKSKHKLAIRHLQRMNNDIAWMKQRIRSLKDSIKQCMICKFGGIIDLDELEESVLRKLVFDLRLSMTDVRSMYEQELVHLKDSFEKKRQEYIDLTKDCTSRYDLLALLNKEKNDLMKKLQLQADKKKTFDVDVMSSCLMREEKDLNKLTSIAEEQRYRIEDLKSEINTLKTKGLPPRTQTFEPPYKKKLRPLKDRIRAERIAEDLYRDGFDYVEEDEEAACTEEQEEGEERMTLIENAEEIVRTLICMMLDQLDTDLGNEAMANLTERIMSKVSETTLKLDVEEIIEDIITSLCYDEQQLTEDMKKIVEDIALEICSLQQPMLAKEELWDCAEEVLDVIISKAVLESEGLDVKSGENFLMVMLTEIVNQLPMDFASSDIALEKISQTLSTRNVTVDVFANLNEQIRNLSQVEDVKHVLDLLMDRMFSEESLEIETTLN